MESMATNCLGRDKIKNNVNDERFREDYVSSKILGV